MRPAGDHFYTLSASERDKAVANSGYVSEGTACWVPDSASPVRAPLYRLYGAGNADHFYTTSASERDNAIAVYGYVSEGITCEVYTVPQPGTVPLHRLYNGSNGDHFYTTSAAERDNAVAVYGYTSEGVACWIHPATSGAQPLYRLYSAAAGDHFYTTSAAERDNAIASYGYVSEGVAGAVLPVASASRVPLYRLYNSSNGDHFYTTSASERQSAITNAGYSNEGVACDVFSQAEAGTIPLHRLYNPGTGDHFYTTDAAERDNAVAIYGYVSESVACHVYGAAGTGRLPLYRLLKRFGAAVDVNVILVGVDNFTQADRTEVVGALNIARDIYAKVALQVRTVQWYGVSAADAGAFEIIDSSSEAHDLSNDWTVPNHAIDLFVVRVMNGADGWSAVNGPCDKNDGKHMTGSVVSLNGPVANSGNTFAHEMGHYLGLNHIADIGNFIGNNGSSNSWTGIYGWQGATMVGHCFVYDV